MPSDEIQHGASEPVETTASGPVGTTDVGTASTTTWTGPTEPGGTPPRRRRFRSWVVARRGMIVGVTAALVVGAGAGAGIAYAATSGDGSRPAAAAAPPAKAGKSGKAGKSAKKSAGKDRTRGTITAESGSTWTLKTKKGTTVTVTLTGDTKFGTKKVPATQAQFTTGKPVVVTGPLTGTTVTATLVTGPAPTATASASPSSSASGSSSA